MILQNYLTYGFGAILSFALLATLYVFVTLIITPILKLNFYKKQGLKTYFYPLLGGKKRSQIYNEKYGDSMTYFRELAKEEPNIRAEAFNFGAMTSMFLYDTKLIKEFYNKPMNTYEKIQPAILSEMFGKGILFVNGNKWKGHRKILSGTFHFEFLKSNIPSIVNTTQEFINELKYNSLKPIDVLNEIQKITGEVVGRIFFGENLNQYQLKGLPLTLYLADLIQRSQEGFKNPLFLLLFFTKLPVEWVPSHHKYMTEVREFRKLCTKIVQERKASNNGGNDMLGLLFESQKNYTEEEGFTDADLVDEFITFFIAGMDTTAHMCTLALFLLYKHPEHLDKVKKEIEEVYNRDSPATSDDLTQMEFTHAVLKETLRLYSPAASIMPRVAQFDHEIGDIKVKKGTTVQVGFFYNNSNEKHFEDPSVFNPDRWLSKKSIDPFTFTPFSAGQRNCIGQHLAMVEAKIILAEFIKAFEFKTVPEDYELKMRHALLYGPQERIRFGLKLKN